MQKKVTILSAVLLLGLTAIGFADDTPAKQTQANETQAVEQATNQFYTSLNALLAGNASEMDQVWSHADNVTYMGPVGGIQTGWDQVRTMWEVQADMKLGGHVEPMELHITVGNDLALVEGYELGTTLDDRGQSESFRIRATSSFRKENGQWKMIGHHTDLLDNLDSDSDKASDEQPSSNEKPRTGSNEQTDATSNDDSINVSEDTVILKLDE